MSFCSRECLAAGEPPAGTGVRAHAYVFLPVPKRLWREREMNAAWASPEELDALRVARKGGVVTRLYNPQPDLAAALVYAGPTPAEGLAPLLELFGRRWPTLQDDAPRLAVCTQGTRERCCAKFGFKVFRDALALHQAGRFPYRPLECSHLGGDRFAATGILFPSGSMYAHLDATDLAALGACESAGRLAPTHYRGRVYDPPLVQIVRAGLARDGLFDDATAPLEVQPLSEHELAVTTPAGPFRVRVGAGQFSFFGSCDNLEAHRRSNVRRPVYESALAEPAPA